MRLTHGSGQACLGGGGFCEECRAYRREQNRRRYERFREQGLTTHGTPPRVGERASYAAVHIRHRKMLELVCQQASEECSGRIEVALDHDTPPERLLGSTDGRRTHYSLSPGDYLTLCVTHHKRYDEVNIKGWETRRRVRCV
jgi:hypothetical protein